MNRFPPLLLALLLAGAIPTAGAAQPEQASRFYEDAQGRFEKNDVAGAIIQLKNALQQDPKLLPAYVLLGKAHLRKGEPGPAEVALTQAVQLGVAPGVVLVPLAQSWLAQGKFRELLDKASADKALPAQRVELLLLRASAHAELGDSGAAAQTLEDARRLDPRSAPIAVAQSALALRAGNLQAAARSADEAVHLAPSDPQAWYARGAAAHVGGDSRAALEAYSKAIGLAADHLDARLARAGLLLDLRREAEAAQDLSALRKSHPLEPRSNYLNAVLAARQGNAAESRARLVETAKFIDPIPPEVLGRKPQLLLLGGLAHHGLKEPEKAKAQLDAYLKLNPRHAGARKLLASILLAEGDTAAVLTVLERAEKLAPNDPQILSLLASAYTARGNHHRATAYLERASQASGGSPALETSLGFSLMSAGRTDAALEQLERVYRKDPGQARAGYALAVLYMKQGQPAKAAQLAGQMAKREPKNPAVQNLLAVARAAAGDRKGARAAYEATLALDRDFLPARLNLGKLDLAEGRPQAAAERFQSILKERPKDTQAMFELAAIEQAGGAPLRAIDWLEKIHAIDRKDLRAGARLVELELRRGKTDRALALARELDGLMPDDLAALALLGRASLAAGQRKAALAAFDRMTVLAQYDAAAQTGIAELQMMAGNLQGAAYSLEKALSARAEFVPALALKAELELRKGETAKAGELARAIVARHPRDAVGHRLAGEAAMAKRAYTEAAASFRAALALQPDTRIAMRLFEASLAAGERAKAVGFMEGWARSHPRDPAALRALAEAYLRTGNAKAARATYEQALELGEDANLLNNLAYVMLRLEDPGATAIAERAYRLDPNDAGIGDTLGWALFRQGRAEDALKYLREARLRAPANPEIAYHLAAALERAGRRDEARREIEDALAGKPDFDELADARRLAQTLRREPLSGNLTPERSRYPGDLSTH